MVQLSLLNFYFATMWEILLEKCIPFAAFKRLLQHCRAIFAILFHCFKATTVAILQKWCIQLSFSKREPYYRVTKREPTQWLSLQIQYTKSLPFMLRRGKSMCFTYITVYAYIFITIIITHAAVGQWTPQKNRIVCIVCLYISLVCALINFSLLHRDTHIYMNKRESYMCKWRGTAGSCWALLNTYQCDIVYLYFQQNGHNFLLNFILIQCFLHKAGFSITNFYPKILFLCYNPTRKEEKDEKVVKLN